MVYFQFINLIVQLLLLLIVVVSCLGSTFNDKSSSSLSSSAPSNRFSKSNNEQSDESIKKSNLSRPKKSTGLLKQEKEQLYEAYNLLHSLAQEFKKPFDSPAVIVIGHQTSGKSALIEALMGFQFNQVGGGTKTRRPIALKMQYNPSCEIPSCFLTLQNGKEESRTLTEIQQYIESENKRLERDPTRCFDEREINIRMEYKYCPNMIVIDTPGMLHAPKGTHLTPQQRALAQAAREAERLVKRKIECQDYIILCVEDTTDWKHATTRNLVAEVDRELTRTVLVTTKLDTKIPQFSESKDLEDFLKAPLITRLFPHLLGGPFFTSVPSGRVGERSTFVNNDAFVYALKKTEMYDRERIKSIMDKDYNSMATASCLKSVGVTKLRSFLEARVEDNYKRNIAKIIPLLYQDIRAAETKLEAIDREISSLSIERLKRRAAVYTEVFCKELALLIQGSIKPAAEEWGENMETEQLQGGSFLDQEQINSPAWQHILELEVTDSKYNLYGGAQYHRAMREFAVAVRHMKAPDVTGDEMANAVGVGDVHDGANFMRASAVIAMHKAQSSFDPMLESLRHRAVYIMKRLYHIVENMNRHDSTQPVDQYSRPFEDMVRRIYEKFVDIQIESCVKKCKDDLSGMTRFVTWDTDSHGTPSFFDSLPTPKKLVQVYKVHVEESNKRTQRSIENAMKKKEEIKSNPKSNGNGKKSGNAEDKILDEWSSANNGGRNSISTSNGIELEPISSFESSNELALRKTNWQEDAELADHYNLLQIMEELTAGRNTNRTETIVKTLVQHVVKQWRTQFARMVITKFNYFYLTPFVDEFPSYLRDELDKVYETGMSDLFDIQDARMRLQAQRSDLMAEIAASQQLQKRFDEINKRMRTHISKESNGMSESQEDEMDLESFRRSDNLNSNNINSNNISDTDSESDFNRNNDNVAAEDDGYISSNENDLDDLELNIDDLSTRMHGTIPKGVTAVTANENDIRQDRTNVRNKKTKTKMDMSSNTKTSAKTQSRNSRQQQQRQQLQRQEQSKRHNRDLYEPREDMTGN